MRDLPHQRRRINGMGYRIGVAILATAGVIGSILVLADPPAEAPEPAASPMPEPVRVKAATLVERTFMGVSCRKPNSIRCDRVGLAVWLERPAESVTAVIAGRRFALEDAEAGRRPRMFVGYLRPAGLADGPLRVPFTAGGRWTGEGAVTPRVRLWIRAGGRIATTSLRSRLRAGFG